LILTVVRGRVDLLVCPAFGSSVGPRRRGGWGQASAGGPVTVVQRVVLPRPATWPWPAGGSVVTPTLSTRGSARYSLHAIPP